MDRRFPHLVPEYAWPRDAKWRAVRAFAKRIRDNTNCQTAFNRASGRLYFYYRSMDIGVFDHSPRDLSDRAVASVCKSIKSGRLSAAEKDWIMAARERDYQAAKAQERGHYNESKRKDAVRLAEQITSNRVVSGCGSKGVF